MSDLNEHQNRNLHYFTGQHCSRQWQGFIQVFIEEIYQTAGEQEARSFLRHMGNRLAKIYPIAVYDSIQDLEKSMNTVFSNLNWGWVAIEVNDYSLLFSHGAFPLPSFGKRQAECEAKIFSALLEGLYYTWMTALGGSPNMVVRTQSIVPDGTFELIYTKP